MRSPAARCVARALAAVGLLAAAGSTLAVELRVVGTALMVTRDDGSQASGEALAGAEIDIAGIGTLRLRDAFRDPDARFGDIWLHGIDVRAEGTTVFHPLCEADPGGDTRALLFQGALDADHRYVDDPAQFSLSCVSGVQAKCLRWGYRPWATAPDGHSALRPYFDACLRMARADYCGDDQPTTRDGTLIDLYDRVGIQSPTPDMTDLAFEAGWSPAGATCVHHVRIADQASLDAIHASCPRLRREGSGAACTEDAALAAGALLFNRSRDAAR